MLVLEAAPLVVLLVWIAEAQVTIQEPPVILLHNDAQSLRQVAANPQGSTGARLSLVCAAYGEPDYPIITWSSPTDGVEDYATLAMNDDSVNVFNHQQLLPNTQLPVTVSILELCNFRPENLTEYLCVAANSNSPRQNSTTLSRDRPLLGAFAMMYSFTSGNVSLSYYEVDQATTPPTASVTTSSQQEPSLTSTQSERSNGGGTQVAAVVAVISTLVVCTVAILAAVLASTVIVVMYKSTTKGSRERTRNRNIVLRHRAQSDNDSLYECNAYTSTTTTAPTQQATRTSSCNIKQPQTNTDSMYECPAYGGHGNDSHQSQHDLSHTYNYIDTPTSPKDKKSAETFTVYQCAAYGAQDQAVPPQDLAMGYSGITETGETVYNYVENSITDRGAR